jgi:hypothetical protein
MMLTSSPCRATRAGRAAATTRAASLFAHTTTTRPRRASKSSSSSSTSDVVVVGVDGTAAIARRARERLAATALAAAMVRSRSR